MRKLKLYLLPVLLGLMMIFCKQNSNSTETEPTQTIVSDEKVALKGYKIGDVATDFSLININGNNVALSDYTDVKGFIVIFTCNHCPYAIAYEDRIIALDQKYKELGYPVIAINPNDTEIQPEDSFENMQIRAQEKGFTFPYLLDEKQTIYPQYGATKTPHVFVLERLDLQNHVVRYIGTIDDNYEDATKVTEKYVENAVDALLNGQEVEVTETRAIGCTIKVK